MPKAALLSLLALAAVTVFHLTTFVLLLVPVLAAALLAYWRLLARRPHVTCRPCRGTGYRNSVLIYRSTGQCPTCTGTGHRARPGVRLLNVR
ncbi:hypothetical protein ACFQ08_33535 [Streptosporangium algeriense]|uniref:Uncharacterized protein n=1 Tax=Streptosporangium algeriense TaxID=1682748 RepID=A0ABW3E095_9ACTN